MQHKNTAALVPRIAITAARTTPAAHAIRLSARAAIAALLAGAMHIASAQVSGDMIAGDAQSVDDVLTVGMGQSAQRFSPLDTISTQNVANLTPAWTFSFGGEKQRGQETQPLVYDGKIFVTGSYSRIWALDAHTGHRLWAYEPSRSMRTAARSNGATRARRTIRGTSTARTSSFRSISTGAAGW